jgi:hypothetical protein
MSGPYSLQCELLHRPRLITVETVSRVHAALGPAVFTKNMAY